MPYATQTQLIDRFGEQMIVRLTDRGQSATGGVDQGTVTRALSDTDALIDGYLAARYTLPIVTVPAILTDLALVIAIYKLHVYEPDAKIVRDYRDAVDTLSRIASGLVRLDVAGVEPETTDGGGAVVTDRERPMTEDSLKGFI